jgi:hypothetical protein
MPTLLSGSTLNYVASETGQVLRLATNGGFCTVTLNGAAAFNLGPLPARRSVGPLNLGDIVAVVANSGDLVYEVGNPQPGNSGAALANRYDAIGTWAQINASGVKAVPGALAFATDLRIRFVSDGTYWRPANGRAILFNGGADFAMAATSVEQTAYTYTLPAGLWIPNGILLVSYGVEKTVAATDTLTHALKIGGTAVPPSNTMATTTLTGGFQRPIRRVSSTSVQQIGAAGNLSAGVAPYGGNGGNASQPRSALTTVPDLDANSNAIILTGKMTTGGADVGNFSGFTIELIA